jgi:hypothetical protein
MDMRKLMAFIIVKIKTNNNSVKHADSGHGAPFVGRLIMAGWAND